MGAKLAEELARSEAASPAELAPHWAAADGTREALAASVEAARQAEAVFGLAEALAHLERALALWRAVPDAAELVAARPRRAVRPDSQTRQPSRRLGTRSRAHTAGDRAHRRGEPAPSGTSSCGSRRVPVQDRQQRRRLRRARSARSRSHQPKPPSPERAYALASLVGRIDARLAPSGAVRSWRRPRRRSRSLAPPAQARKTPER